ncbi:hypothetical protein BJ508DRAFT_330819 [Ascobolus immersus RN42]|uniref:Uncharacterized protein n=1 Tax=Ascobolus immersus RN42 TaxID=1160509 RepID=A0A3N4HW46_ASCIM|nr:hypothetical protein BJ508DRAFT_330819 [Ascobolus immersus RN42]
MPPRARSLYRDARLFKFLNLPEKVFIGVCVLVLMVRDQYQSSRIKALQMDVVILNMKAENMEIRQKAHNNLLLQREHREELDNRTEKARQKLRE